MVKDLVYFVRENNLYFYMHIINTEKLYLFIRKTSKIYKTKYTAMHGEMRFRPCARWQPVGPGEYALERRRSKKKSSR